MANLDDTQLVNSLAKKFFEKLIQEAGPTGVDEVDVLLTNLPDQLGALLDPYSTESTKKWATKKVRNNLVKMYELSLSG